MPALDLLPKIDFTVVVITIKIITTKIISMAKIIMTKIISMAKIITTRLIDDRPEIREVDVTDTIEEAVNTSTRGRTLIGRGLDCQW